MLSGIFVSRLFSSRLWSTKVPKNERNYHARHEERHESCERQCLSFCSHRTGVDNRTKQPQFQNQSLHEGRIISEANHSFKNESSYFRDWFDRVQGGREVAIPPSNREASSEYLSRSTTIENGWAFVHTPKNVIHTDLSGRSIRTTVMPDRRIFSQCCAMSIVHRRETTHRCVGGVVKAPATTKHSSRAAISLSVMPQRSNFLNKGAQEEHTSEMWYTFAYLLTDYAAPRHENVARY